MATIESPGEHRPADPPRAADAPSGWWRSWLSVMIAIVAGLLFSAITLLVVDRATEPFDVAILLAVHQLDSPLLTTISLALAVLGGPYFIGGYLVILIAVSWPTRYRRAMVFPTISYVGAALWTHGLKHLIQRARPEVFTPLATESTYSFPSGHASASFCFFGALIVLAWLYLRRPGLKVGLTVLLAGLVLAIGLSRLYLGVHYPSDVLGSYVAGLAWMITCGAVVFRLAPITVPTSPPHEKGAAE